MEDSLMKQSLKDTIIKKIIIYNLVNVLTIFPIHVATHFMCVFMENKDIYKWHQTFER